MGDEPQEVGAGAVDPLEILDGAGGVALGELLLEELAIADDRVERGPQLMAHVGQEGALGPVGGEGLVAGLGQGVGGRGDLDRDRQLGGDRPQDLGVAAGEDPGRDPVVEVDDADQALAEEERRGEDAPQVLGDDALGAEHDAVLGAGDDQRVAGEADLLDDRPAKAAAPGQVFAVDGAPGDDLEIAGRPAEEEEAALRVKDPGEDAEGGLRQLVQVGRRGCGEADLEERVEVAELADVEGPVDARRADREAGGA